MTQLLDRRLAAVVFTDMVGYTALMQEDERVAVGKRDRYWRALERRHDEFGGTIVQRLGDGSMSMFPSSLAAVNAAIAIQQELAPDDVPVRIGVHVGEVIVEPERLTGETVNIAARIESFAVAGGVMMSDSAYDQIRNRSDVGVVPLGRFRLKNVGRPYELYAVAADGVVVPDAPLEGKGEAVASLPSHLPEPSSPLIGRAGELEALADLARGCRVVTITGTGGVGKSRILIELGWLLAPEFLDGVAFVALADVSEPAEFVPALAEALDVKEAEGRTLGEGIVALVGARKALLLLDNFEQIVEAAPEVARLVERCPELRIVTTSRTPLRIGSEHEYALAPLEIPPPSEEDSTESLAEYPSVVLFVDRAAATKASFELTAENARAVAGSAGGWTACRLRSNSPLPGSACSTRRRCSSGSITRSRCSPPARGTRTRGSRRSAPPSTGATRSSRSPSNGSSAASRCSSAGAGSPTSRRSVPDPGESILDDLESLVDKALVQTDSEGNRFRMLQTIAEYAHERLEAAREADAIALGHARRYAGFVRETRDGIEGADQLPSVARAVSEEGNIQSALDTLLVAARNGDGDACEAGLQMSGDLLMYWHIRRKNLTAREYALAFLDADEGGAATVGRAGALVTAGLASWALGQIERCNEEWSEAYRIAAALDAGRELCVAAIAVALGLIGLDTATGLERAREGLKRARALGFAWAEGFASNIEGILHTVAGDLGAARDSHARALEIQQRLGDEELAGISLGGLAQLQAIDGELEQALELYRQSLAAFEAVGDRAEEARILSEMAWTHLARGETPLARGRFFDSVQAYGDVASVRGVGLSLIGLAAVAAVDERPETAVRIAAAAEVYAAAEGIVNVYSDETPGREYVERARATLSDDEAARATEAGRRLTIEEALDLARA